jgi:hypothetical protein
VRGGVPAEHHVRVAQLADQLQRPGTLPGLVVVDDLEALRERRPVDVGEGGLAAVDVEDACQRRAPVGASRLGRLIASSQTARALSLLAFSGKRSTTHAAPAVGISPSITEIP